MNGFYIDEAVKNEDCKVVWHLSRYGEDDKVFEEKDIKNIVTKEQFKNVMYEV